MLLKEGVCPFLVTVRHKCFGERLWAVTDFLYSQNNSKRAAVWEEQIMKGVVFLRLQKSAEAPVVYINIVQNNRRHMFWRSLSSKVNRKSVN